MPGKPVIQTAHSAAPRGNRVPKPSKPWRRPNLLAISEEQKKAHPGKHPRWIRKGKEGDQSRIEQKLEQGYEIDRTRSMKSKDQAAKGDLTGATTRRDCVLMWLSDERKQARDYDLQEKSDLRRQQLASDHDARARSMGGVGLSGKDAIPNANDRKLAGDVHD